MKAAEYERRILALEQWARDEIAKLGTRPISSCPKVDDQLYEVAWFRARVAEVEDVVHYVSTMLSAEYFGGECRAEPPAKKALLALALVAAHG